MSHLLKNCQPSWIFTTPAQYETVTEGLDKANVSVKVCLHAVTLYQQDYYNYYTKLIAVA